MPPRVMNEVAGCSEAQQLEALVVKALAHLPAENYNVCITEFEGASSFLVRLFRRAALVGAWSFDGPFDDVRVRIGATLRRLKPIALSPLTRA